MSPLRTLLAPATVVVVALLVFSQAVCNASSVPETTIVFGVNLALYGPSTQSYTANQIQAYQGFVIWQDWWNALPASSRKTTWGKVINVELHIETYSNYIQNYTYDWNYYAMQEVYASMARNASIDYLFATVASPWDIQLRNYTYYELGVPVTVAPADSSLAWYAIPNSFGAPTANVLTMTSYLPYLRVAQAETVLVIRADETYQTELCQGVLDQAPLNSLQVVSDWIMDFDYNTMGSPVGNPARIANWTAALGQAREMGVDALIMCDYGPGAEWALTYMRDTMNWIPNSVTLSTLFEAFEDWSLLDYVTTASTYNAHARFANQTSFVNSEGYNDLVVSKFNTTATDIHALATLAGMIYTNALVNSPSNRTSDVIQTITSSQISSFMGTSSFDVNHHQTLSALVLQWLDSTQTTNVIGPALAAAEALIYPIPTWTQRIFAPTWGSGAEIAGTVLMALGGAVSLAWTAFLFRHWRHRVIHAASPFFCLAIVLGSLVVFVSIFSWMPNLISDSICSVRVWLLPLGFMTMFGSLLAKTNRIHRLYNTRGVDVMIISDLDVALVVLLIVGLQAIFSILMIAIPQLEANIMVVDQYRVSLNYYVCTFSVSLQVLMGINIAYAGLLLVWGSYLAWRVRKVPIALYDESKVIAFAIYNTAICAVIVIVVQLAVGNSNRDLTFVVTAVFCFLGATITTCCLFGAKAYAIYHPRQITSSSRTTARTSSNTSSNSGGSHSNKSNAEDEALKKKAHKEKVKQLRERIRQLEALAKANGFLQEDEEMNVTYEGAAEAK